VLLKSILSKEKASRTFRDAFVKAPDRPGCQLLIMSITCFIFFTKIEWYPLLFYQGFSVIPKMPFLVNNFFLIFFADSLPHPEPLANKGVSDVTKSAALR